jgi:PAS domain S-box-containing protein
MALHRFGRWVEAPALSPRRIALIYVAVGAGWILLSDRLVALVVTSPAALTGVQTAKGWCFVLVTAVLLYVLVAASLASSERREQRFHALLEGALDVIFVVGDTGAVRYASPSVHTVLGYEPLELRDTDLMDLLHPDDVAAAAAHLRDAVLGGPGSTGWGESRFRHRDGSWRVLQSVARNLLDDSSARS